MKTISKTLLATAAILGTTALIASPASAFEGKGEGRMRPEGGPGGRGEGYHLISQEMRESWREEHKAEFENLSEEERQALREEHRAERQAQHEERQAEMSEFSGLSEEELKEARENQNMGEALEAQGISEADAETFLTDNANERVDEIVERHSLDESEETTLRERIPEFVQSILDRWFN